jgi:hypothetical protein
MAKLIGAQRMVLQAILDLPKDVADNVTDNQIAQATQISLGDVRNWLETLEGDGNVNVARTTGGLAASITAHGKLALWQYQPFETRPSGSTGTSSPIPATATPPGIPPVRTILLLAANPKGTPPLRLDEEVKKIDQGLERAKKRDQFKLVQKWAVTDDDLRRAMLDNDPEIVHFSGHGSGADGLAFEDDAGNTQLISGDSLGRLFELCSDTVKCVVLNACYSEAQADAISQHIDYVVGMKKAIGDEAAIKFAVGFYDALGAGRDVEKAFKFGCIAIDLKGIPEYLTPVLKKKS